MAKLVSAFFAVLAFQAVFALHTKEERNKEVQELLKEVQTVSTSTLELIQGVPPTNEKQVHSLYSQAHEFSRNLRDVVHHLLQVVYRIEDGQDEALLSDVVDKLGEIVQNVQTAIHFEPNQLKLKLKTEVQKVVVEARRLAEIARREQTSEEINDNVEDALTILLDSIQQLQVRNKIQTWTHEQITTHIQGLLVKASQEAKLENQDTIDSFIHYLIHHVGQMIYQIRKDIKEYDLEVQSRLKEVLNKLSEIRVASKTKEVDIDELKKELKTDLKTLIEEVQKLVEMVYTYKLNDHDEHNLKDSIESVVARAIVATTRVYKQTGVITETDKVHRDSVENY